MTQEQMARLLTERGVRPTQQRLAVYDYLLQHRTHPSAEAVYKALVVHHPTFSRTTVYNSLHALVKAGLVQELSLGTEEKHYDGDASLHGHFYCCGCSQIYDFPLQEEAINALQPDGFKVYGRAIHFSGFCSACGKAAST
ncbi:MAG: transcriptional repressor [Ruminococcaceae bacterium]|nr:transcriptional repressor [Oscillospiraceae bacterium]